MTKSDLLALVDAADADSDAADAAHADAESAAVEAAAAKDKAAHLADAAETADAKKERSITAAEKAADDYLRRKVAVVPVPPQ